MPQQHPTPDSPVNGVDTSINALFAPPVDPPTKAIAQAATIDPKALKTDVSALYATPQLPAGYKPIAQIGGSAQQTTSDSQYLEGLTVGQDPNLVKAKNQGFWDSMGNAAAQTVVGTALDFVEGVGYLGVGELIDKVRGTEQDFGNSLSSKMAEWGKQFNQEVAPIYTSPEDQGFNPLSYKWWATNIPSIASAVSLLLPAAGATKLLGKLGKGVGLASIKAAKGMNKLDLAKKLGIGMDVIEAGEPIAMAALSRHMEGMMEGMEVYDGLHQRALSEGKSEEQAAEIAGKGATSTYLKNLPLIATDIVQFGLAFKTFKGMSRAASESKVSKNLLAEISAQVGTESFEEAYQSIAAKEAERTALIEAKFIKDDDSIYGDRLLEYLTDPEVQTAAFFGGFGGAAFAGVGGAMENKALAQQKLKNNTEAANMEKAFAAYKDNPTLFAKSVDTDIIGFSVSSIYKGRAKQTQEMYETMRDAKHEGKTPEEIAYIKERATLAISDLNQLEETYNNVFKDRTKQKSLDLTGYEMTNRAKVLTDTRHFDNAKKIQGTVIEKIAKERNLDPTYSSLLQGELELDMMRNEFKGAKVDEEVKKAKIDALEKETKAIRDTIKTNEGISDKEINAKLSINKEELAYATRDKLLFEVSLGQYAKDFDKLQTNEGRKEVSKEMEEFHKHQQNKDLAKITNQITYKSTFAELTELRAAAKKLDKEEQFATEFKDKLDKVKGAAPKYNPNNVEASITERFTYSPLLRDYETNEIKDIAKTTNAALPELTPKAIADAAKTNTVFANEITKYFAKTDIQPVAPTKKDAKKTPIKENKELPDGSNENGIRKPEVEAATGNKSAWQLVGQQFEIKTDFVGDGVSYSYAKIVHSETKIEHKYYAKPVGEVGPGKEITEQAYKIASRSYSEPDPNKPFNTNLSKKIAWEFINRGMLPANSTVYLEYDIDDTFNKKLASEKRLTPHSAVMEFAYYIDGNNGNKQKENRMVVGVLRSYDSNTTYNTPLEKQQLKALRERAMQEVYDSGAKTGIHTTSINTTVFRTLGGYFWKGKPINPLSTLRGDQELVLAIGERYQLDDGTYSTRLNVNGHALQDEVQDWKSTPGMLYMLIRDAGKRLVNYKMYTKKLKQKPGTAEIMVRGAMGIKEAKTFEEKSAILAQLNQIAYVKDINYVDGVYEIDSGNVEKPGTDKKKEDELLKYFEEFIFQVDVSKINKTTKNPVDGTTVVYNEDICNRELIDCDLHPFTHFHSASVEINPIHSSEVKVTAREEELPPADLSVSTGPTIIATPTVTTSKVVPFITTLPAKDKKQGDQPAHFHTAKEAREWLAPDISAALKMGVALEPYIKKKYGKVLSTYSEEARGMVVRALDSIVREHNQLLEAVAIETPIEKKPEATTIAPTITPVIEVLTPASGGTPSIPATAPKRERKSPPIITDAGSLDVPLAESQPQPLSLEFPEIKGDINYTTRGMYETSIGFVVVYEPGTNIADTDLKTYTTKAAAKGAITRYKNKHQTGKPSTVEEIGAYTPLNEIEVRAWFAKNLPQVDVSFVDNLIEIHRNGGAQAWGVFYDNAIELFKGAPRGTEHHEAFHAVFDLLLNQAQREQLYNEAAVKYNIPRENISALEEAMADSFIGAVQEDFANIDSFTGEIKKFFKKLYQFLKSLFTSDINMESLFFRINTGFYKNKKLQTGVSARKYRPKANPYKTTRNIKYINALFFDAVAKYKEQQNLGDISDAEAVRHISSNVKKGILALYEQVFNTIAKRADSYKADPSNKFDELMDILDEFMEIENGKVVKTKWYYTQAIRELSKFGVKASGAQIKDNTVADTDRDDKQYELNEEEDALESWQRTAIETNGKDSLSYNIRKMLRLSTKWKIKAGEVFEENKDTYDFPEFVDFDDLYNYLQKHLAGTLNVDDMILAMHEYKYHRPDLHGILQKLEKDPSLKSQFFTNFAQTYKPSNQVDRTIQRGQGPNGPYKNVKFRIYNANRKNLHQLILNQWDLGLTTPELNDITNPDGEIVKSRAEAYFKEYEAIVKRMQTSGRITFEDNVMLSNVLKKFGMIIDPMALQKEFVEKKVRVNKKEFKVTEPYANYMALVNGTRSIKTIIRRIASGGNPYVGSSSETSSAKYVTRVVSKNTANLHQDTFINGDGKQVFSYSLPTFIDKKLEELKDQTQRKGYINNWWFKYNKWLQDLDDTNNAELINEFNVILVDSIKLDGGKPTKYFSMTDKELDVTDINMFDNNSTEAYAYYRLPILSDSPQAPYAKFKKYSEGEIIDGLYQVALAEKERIAVAKATDIKVKHWNTGLNNGFKYNFVTIFNTSDVDLANEKAAKDVIKQWMDAEGKLEMERLIENGVLKKDGSFDDTVSDKSNNKNFLRNYFYNKFFGNIMLTQLLGVDLAYYKNGEDFQKRWAQVFKFTKMLDVTAVSKDGTATGATYNVVYMKDNIIKSTLRDTLKKDLLAKGYSKEYAEQQAKLFDEVNQTDAQTYITLTRRKKIDIGLGQWPDEKEAAYQAIMSGEPYDPKLEVLFGPYKPFNSEHEVVGNDPKTALVIPVQHKNSEVILFPSVAKKAKELGNSDLQNILDYLDNNKVDALLFNSAVKNGEHGTAENVAGLKNATIHTMRNKYYGIQQETPEHHIDTENRYGSQVRKEIIADIPDTFVDKDGNIQQTRIGGHLKKDIVDLYHRLIIDNIKESYGNLAKELGSIEKVHELLLDEIVNRSLGEFYEIAVEIRNDVQGNKVFNLPLFHPIHAKRFEQILNAVVRNRVVNQKINGGSFALMSNFGFTDELKVITNKETGAIEYMECYLPAWSKEWFENYRDKNGEVDIDKIRKDDPTMLELFGYRIPTEHKYSMKGLKVKGFLPDIMGGTIMLPAEITRIAGEDFDIDKLYVMIPNIRSVYHWGDLQHDFNLAHDFLSWREKNGYSEKSLTEIIDTIDNKDQLGTATEAEKLFEKQYHAFTKAGKAKYFVRAEKITYGGIDGLIKEKTDTSTLSKRQRDNALIDINRMIWSDPSVSDQVINPGGSGTLKDLAIAKRKKKGINESANPLLPRVQMQYFQGNTSGAELVGIGANHNVNHAIAQFSELALARGILINGEGGTGGLTKLNIQKALDGQLISRNLAEFLTAFVDNAKDPIAGDLNINTFTFDTVAMMTRLGLSLKDVTDFINQPIIEHFAKEYFRAGGGFNSEKEVYDKILKTLSKKTKATIEVKAHNLNLGMLKASNSINPDTYTDQVAQEQLMVLFSFMEYKKQADSLAKFVRATRNDSLGTRKTMAGNTKAMMDMEKALEDKNLRGVAGVLLGDEYPLIKEGTEYGLNKPQKEILDKLFPYYKIGYRELYRKLEANKGRDLTEDEINYVNNLTLVYYGTGFNYFNLNHRSAWLNDYPKLFQKTLFKPVTGENIAELDPKFEEYEFLKYIAFRRADEEGALDRIEFVSGATMSNEQREYVTRSWESMLVSDDPEVAKLASDLVKYSFFTNGMTFSYGGFSHLIPTNHLDKLADPNDPNFNFRDYLYKLQENAKNPKMFDNFMEQMFRHDVKRWGLLPQLKDNDIAADHRKFKNGVTTSIVLTKKQVNFDEQGMIASEYFKIWNGFKNKYLTYKYVGTTPSGDFVFNVLSPLGSGSNIYEYDVTNPGVNSVLKENDLGGFTPDDFFPTTNENMPTEEQFQLNGTRELELKYGLADVNGIYKSYGKEGKGQSSTDAYNKARAVAARLNKEVLGSGYKAIVGKQDDKQGGVNTIVQIVDEYYQVGSQESTPDEQLNDLLKTRMQEFGVDVRYTEDFIKRMGGDVNAVTNAVQKTILVSKQLENRKTLPEEVGHIAESYNRGLMAHNRLMELVVHTPEYEEAKRDYTEAYNSDETKIKQEAIGKLIGNTIIKQTRPVNNTLLTYLTKLWNDFLNLFRNADQYKLQNEIEAITGKYATDVIEGNFETWNTTVAIEGEFYQLSTASAQEVEQLLKNSIDTIYKKIEIYKNRSSKAFTEREKEIFNDLSLSLAKNQHKAGLLKYVVNASKEMQKVMTRYEKMNHNPQTNEEKRDTLKTLTQMDNYVDGFKNILNEIASSNIFEANTAAEKNLVRFVGSVSSIANKLEKQYYKVGKPILADILKEFSTNPNVDILGALDILEKDISWGKRMLNELASSGEPILNIIDKMVKEHKNTARVETIGMSKTLLQLQKDLEASGIPTTHFMYERDHQGRLTGNIISEFNEGEWNNRRKAFFKDNPMPEDPKSKDKNVQKIYKAKLKEWRAKVGIWHTNNTQPHPEKEKIMAAKRAEMIEKYGDSTTRSVEGNIVSVAELNYNAWLGENTIQSTYFNHQTGEPTFDVRYKKELAVPSEEYRNRVFADIQDTTKTTPQLEAMRAYYNGAKKILDELDAKLPEYYKLNGMAPQVRKDFFERLTITDDEGTKTFKSLRQVGREAKESLAENFVKHENDTEYGLTDENNQPINFLPVRFTTRMQDPSNLSLDLTSSLIAFAYSANDFSEMSKIIDVLEYTKDVVGERKVRTGKFDRITMFKNVDDNGKPIMMDGKESMAYKRLDDWMKMVVYGQSSKDEGSIFGVDKGKLVDFVNSYTSLASLALNLYSGISNVTVGYAMTKMEAVAGEFFNNGDIRKADRIYASELPKGLANVGQRLSDSKLDLWLEYMNTMQNYDRDYRNVDAARNTLFSRLFKTSSLFFLNHAGEHLIQSRLSLALAQNTQVKDKDGKIMSLWDAYEVVGNELKLRGEFTKVAGKKTTHLFKKEEDGQPLTQKDIFRFINRQNFLNKRMHGIYNDIDKNAAQQYALGRLGMMFRKFIIPGWNRRYAKMTYNEEGETSTEGYYRTAFRFFGLVDRELNQAKFSLAKNWENLSDADKANFHRLFTEWAFMIGSVVVAGVLTQFADDDEDNYFLNLAAYEAYRTYSEIRFFSSVSEAWRIVKSPAPSMYMVDRLIRFMEVWNWNEEIDRGPFKGHTKFERGFAGVVPLGGTIINVMTPEEQLKFFTNNGITWF